MKNLILNFVFIVLILVMSFTVFYLNNNYIPIIENEYIGILIFFFATITGVFISRQGRRYNLIIKSLTDFNGNLSFQYRGLDMFEKKYQNKFSAIVKKFYLNIDNKESDWDWFIKEKTTVLTDVNKLYMEIANDIDLNKLQGYFLNSSQISLRDMHKIRKNLVPLVNEKIPIMQWITIILLALGLVISIFSFDSYLNIFESILKSFFLISIFLLLLTLYHMNKLNSYENRIGESSARDLLDIIDGKK